VEQYTAQVKALTDDLAAVDAQLTDLTDRRVTLQEQVGPARFQEHWEQLYQLEDALATVEGEMAIQQGRQRELRLALARPAGPHRRHPEAPGGRDRALAAGEGAPGNGRRP
jgi:hypothetical protein